MPPPPTLPDVIEEPHAADGWTTLALDDAGSAPGLLRELCAGDVRMLLGGVGLATIPVTLRTVDEVNRQLVFVSSADGIAVVRAVQALPLWAAGSLRKVRVMLQLRGASCLRDGNRVAVRTDWPDRLHRLARRRAPRLQRAAHAAPVARFHHSNNLGAKRDFAVIDISELGCAVLLPAGLPPPVAGMTIRRVELELDADTVVFTDACVQHVTPLERGAHRIGCRFEGMPPAGRRALEAWLARAHQPQLDLVVGGD